MNATMDGAIEAIEEVIRTGRREQVSVDGAAILREAAQPEWSDVDTDDLCYLALLMQEAGQGADAHQLLAAVVELDLGAVTSARLHNLRALLYDLAGDEEAAARALADASIDVADTRQDEEEPQGAGDLDLVGTIMLNRAVVNLRLGQRSRAQLTANTIGRLPAEALATPPARLLTAILNERLGLAAAESEAFEAASGIVRQLAPGDPERALALASYANLAFEAARASGETESMRRAAEVLQAATQLVTTSLGAANPRALVVGASSALASFQVAHQRGSVEETRVWSEALADIRARISLALGPEHPYALGAGLNEISASFELARLTGDARRYPSLATALDEVCRALERTLGPNHARTLNALANRAIVEAELARVELSPQRALRAADMLEATAERIRSTSGDRDRLVAGLRQEVGICRDFAGELQRLAEQRRAASGRLLVETGDEGFPPAPHDDAAERNVLAAMMMSRAAIPDVIESLSRHDFYHERHALVFDAIVDLYGRGHPVDETTVAFALARLGEAERVGGLPYLHSLLVALPTAANASFYAAIVADRAARRRLIAAAETITRLASDQEGGDPAPDLRRIEEQAWMALYEATERRPSRDTSLLADIIGAALDGIEAAGVAPADADGIPTGYVDLDELLGGLRPGQLVAVAGRPGVGTSTVALDLVRSAAIRHGLPAVLFSPDTRKQEIVVRLLAAEARVTLRAMRSGAMTDDDWTRLARRMGEISEAPLFIDDSESLGLGDIAMAVRHLKRRDDLRLVVVDPVDMLSRHTRGQDGPRHADLMEGLKRLARETECAVVAVHRLNRPKGRRRRPELSDLPEAVERTADLVVLVHREDQYERDTPRAGEADLIVAKNRTGPTTVITVAAQLHYARFVDLVS